MRTIHKEAVPYYGSTLLKLPRETEFLTVQLQHNVVAVWFLRDIDVECDTVYEISSFVTGGVDNIPFKGKYLGTIQFDSGMFVKHYFVWRK
jgi:hypothetical protein